MRAREPAVSVVLPTYNRLASLSAAVNSVLAQSFDDLELIVVDDGSTDGTAEMLGTVGDDRLRVVRPPRRFGAPASRNAGLQVARGRYVAFQDSDDVWRPGKLSTQVAALDDAPDNVAVVYGAIVRHLVGGDVRIPRAKDQFRSGDLAAALPAGNFISLPAALVRAEVLREVGGFDELLPRYQDWDLWLTLSRRVRFRYVDDVVVDSADTIGSITRDRNAHFDAVALILRKHADLFAKVPDAAIAYRLQLARHAVATRHVNELGTHVRAVWKIGGWHGLGTVTRRVRRSARPMSWRRR